MLLKGSEASGFEVISVSLELLRLVFFSGQKLPRWPKVSVDSLDYLVCGRSVLVRRPDDHLEVSRDHVCAVSRDALAVMNCSSDYWVVNSHRD